MAYAQHFHRARLVTPGLRHKSVTYPSRHSSYFDSMKAKVLYILLVTFATQLSYITHSADWFAAPNATASGTGTISNPWQLQVALNGPAAVKPGDTIWLRGGLYNGKVGGGWDAHLTGTITAPIIVRNYNNERAILNDPSGDGGDDPLQAWGAYVWFWGLEFQCNSSTSGWADGVSLLGNYMKAINCVAHDVMGVAFWTPYDALGTEVYGNIAYYSGRQTETQNGGYGIYAQNTSGTKKRIVDNVFFHQWGNYSTHFYTQTSGRIDDFYVDGNISVDNCFFIGSADTPAANCDFLNNYVYVGTQKASGVVAANFGFWGFGVGTRNARVLNNYFASPGAGGSSPSAIAFQPSVTGLNLTGNTFYGALWGITTSTYPQNSYYIQSGTGVPPRPSGVNVFVRPNQYEPGRAHVAVYNWANQDTVAVDVSSVDRFNLGTKTGTGSLLAVGDAYEVRDVQNLFGTPVLTGTYSGSPLILPMTSTAVSQPIGKTAPAHTSKEFGTFIIRRTGTTPPSSAAPQLPTIPNQSGSEDTASAVIPVLVTDPDTAASAIVLTATSSDTTVISAAGITLAGSGSNRTVSLVPMPNKSGTSTITLTANDGFNTASTSFTYTVLPVNDTPSISGIANVTIPSNSTTTPLPITISDPETSAASLSLTADSSDKTLLPLSGIVLGGTAGSRTITLTPAVNRSGTSTVTVTVSDGALTASSSFVLTVNAPPANTAPTLSVIANANILVNTSTAPLAFTIGDAESAASALTLSASASPATLVPLANVVFGGSGANRTVTVTPAANQSGTATIYVTVSDGALTAQRSFIVVVAANTPPAITTIPATTISKDTSTAPLAFTVSDAEISAIDLVVTARSDNATLVPATSLALSGTSSNRTLTVTPATGQSGSATITLTVSDGSASTSSSFSLTVSGTNKAPTISKIPNITVTAGVTSPPVSFTISDSETPASSLTLSATTTPTTLVPSTGVVFGGSGTNRYCTVTANPGSSGSATVYVTVSDGSLQARKSFTVSVVNTNTVPTISSLAPTTIYANSVRSNVLVTVGDGQTAAADLVVDAISSNATLLPKSGLVLTGTGGSRYLSISPANNQIGTANISLTVSDGVLSATNTFALSVIAPTTPPTISAFANVSVPVNTALPTITFVVGHAQVTSSRLTLTGSSSNPTLVPVSGLSFSGTDATRSLSITPAANQVGTSTIVVTVSDGFNTTSASFVLTVTSVAAKTYLTLQAESGTLGAPMQALVDAAAGGGKYVSTTTANTGTATIAFNTTTAGTYIVWCRVLGASASSDSFFVSVDGGAEDIYDTTEGSWSASWQWTKLNGRNGLTPLTLNPRTFSLGAGSHTIQFRGREVGAPLDQILITDDLAYTP